MDFQDRLNQAINRGTKRAGVEAQRQAENAMTQAEMKRRHSHLRTELAERIEKNLQAVRDQFPGFDFTTIISGKGWGARIRRDDLMLEKDRTRTNYFSQMELVISPLSEYNVLDLVGKATIHNKEVFRRNFFKPIVEVEIDLFRDLIDSWAIEFAENFAAKG